MIIVPRRAKKFRLYYVSTTVGPGGVREAGDKRVLWYETKNEASSSAQFVVDNHPPFVLRSTTHKLFAPRVGLPWSEVKVASALKLGD